MAKSKDQDESTTSTADDGSKRLTIRMDQSDFERLEAAVKEYRKQTGAQESPTGFGRTLILIGLQNFERAGGLVVG